MARLVTSRLGLRLVAREPVRHPAIHRPCRLSLRCDKGAGDHHDSNDSALAEGRTRGKAQ
jgi:hypothetical protein